MEYQILKKYEFGTEIESQFIKYWEENLMEIIDDLKKYKNEADHARILGMNDTISCLGYKICDSEGNNLRVATHFRKFLREDN